MFAPWLSCPSSEGGEDDDTPMDIETTEPMHGGHGR